MYPLAAALTDERATAAESTAMDEENFRLFYNRTARPLRAYLAAALHDRSLADDLLQEAFLRFLQADLPASMEDDHQKNYLFRIATNLMRDHFRSAHRQRATSPPSHERLDERVAQKNDTHRIMEKLKPRERELLWLAYVEQFSHTEIAAMMGAKTQSIRSMLARARASCRHHGDAARSPAVVASVRLRVKGSRCCPCR
jgi:RNA polymerase sigma-70 factor, ECF subfamily